MSIHRATQARLIQSIAKSMLDCDLGPFKRIGTPFIGQVEVAFILNLEANFKLLAYIQVFIGTDTHIFCEGMEKGSLRGV